jgi:flagellar motor switch protein FliN/FliY
MSDTMKLPNLDNQHANTEDLMQDLDDEPNLSKHKVTTHDLEAVYTIPINVKAVLGEARMEVNQLLKLGRGAVVELDRKVGEPIDIYVNNRLVARGEVVIVDDRLGVTMTEIIKSGAV